MAGNHELGNKIRQIRELKKAIEIRKKEIKDEYAKVSEEVQEFYSNTL